MYLSELKLWNFRKYGITGKSFETAGPGLCVKFKDGVNVLVGENDSGKTAIVDAIRYVLRTHSLEYINIDDKDFHKSDPIRTNELKIECTFSGFDPTKGEAGHFLEWIGFEQENFVLKVWLYAKRREDNSIFQMVKAGMDADGTYLEGDARNLLRVVYLKPLRDALLEMSQGYKSRLAQILKSHKIFKKERDNGILKPHKLEEKYTVAKKSVDNFFLPDDEEDNAAEIVEKINTLLTDIFIQDKQGKASINMSESELPQILRLLNLVLEDDKSGLGTLNLLYMAAELLHLDSERPGLKLTLIEELEAHLHPQMQLSLIEFIQNDEKNYGQFILTTHSTTLASKINLEKLILCKGNKVYPMGHDVTQLDKGDYKFLERFLDATKANLFFAKGVILVEGDAENLLIPTIAQKIGRPLHRYGVSIVNVGSTAFNRYRKIFLRKGKDSVDDKKEWLDIPVSLVTDLDVRSIEYWDEQSTSKDVYYLDKSFISELTDITNSVSWENLENEIFTSESNFEDSYKAYKTKRFQKGAEITKKLKNHLPKLKKEINNQLISQIRENKNTKLIEKYNSQYIRVFIPNYWTLEYDIAKSCLYQELAVAVEMARQYKSNNNLILKDEDIDKIRNEVEKECNTQTDENAYKIFKPLNASNVSKATTAQCLAELIDNCNITKDQIVGDNNLKYLVNAIEYVTKPLNKGGSDV